MEEKEEEISLYDILLTILKGKKTIIITTILTMVFAFLFALITKFIDPRISPMPDLYTSTCELMFIQSGNSPSPFGQSANSLTSLLNLSSGSNTNSFLLENLLQGETFLLEVAAATEFNLYDIYKISEPKKTNLIRELRSIFTFEIDDESGIMRISFTDVNPQLAWQVLSKAIPILENRYKALYQNQLEEKFFFFDGRIKEAEENLKKATNELFAFQKKHGIYDFHEQVKNQFSIYNSTSKEILAKEVELDYLSEYRSKSDPMILQKVKEIQKHKQLLREFETGSGRYSLNVIPMNQLQNLSAEYTSLQREVELKQQVYLLLRQQQEAARMEQSGQISSLQILEYPQVPELKSKPSRGKFCIFMTFLALFLSTVFVFFRAFSQKTNEDPEYREKWNDIKNAANIKKIFRGKRGY